MADTRAEAIWGSVEAGGGDILVNLRLVRYARPTADGTRLHFAADDSVEVTAPFAIVARRLYHAFDEGAGEGGGDDEGGKGDGEGGSGSSDESGDQKQS